MKSARVSRSLGLAALAVITGASPFAFADETGWYGGLNAGQSKAKIDDVKTTGSLLGGGFTTTSENNRNTGGKLFGGYQFNDNFALEGGIFDLGKYGFTATTLPAGTLNGTIKLRGLNFDTVGILPLTTRLAVFGRVGLNYAEARDSFAGTGSVAGFDAHPSKLETNYKYGLGLQYDLSRSFRMRAEMERYRVNDAVGNRGNIDLVSIGLVYRFDAKPGSPAHRAAVAERIVTPTFRTVAEPPPPPIPVFVVAPAPVIVPVPAKTDLYCGIIDFQFEIDQDSIQREEQEKLAAVAAFLKKYPDSTAVIEGHTDNVGTAESNLQLSRRRAQSVVSSLVDNFGISPLRLSSVGYGETRPLVDNASELGKRMNRRIDAVIACTTDIAGLTVIPSRLTMALKIEFDRNQAEIRPQYGDDLRKVADFLKANPSVTATVEGHTGNLQATPELAMEISRQRARHVVNYLVDNFGIDATRLSAEGFGQTRRFAYNTSQEGPQENRRVNIIFNYAR